MTRRASASGFTLLEVMIALAILGAGLTVLLSATAANVAKSLRAQDLAIGAELGRGKMYDLEEELLEEGFQELNQEREGDFSDEGWPDVTWKAEIVKIELPSIEALAAGSGEDDEGGEDGAPGVGGGLLGGVLGGGLGGEDSQGTAAGASMFGALYEPIRNVAEMAVRKVTLTVTWRVAGNEETLVLDCYFTDPNAIQQAIKGLPLVSLATVSYDTSMGLVVLADSAIKTPKDLAGKTVGSTLTSGEYPFLPTFYKNVGVDPGTIKSVAVDNKVRERSLLDGLVDAISAFGTSAVPKILAAGKTPKVFLYSKFGLPFYGNSLTTSPAYFAKEKALCEAVTVGLCEGVKSTLLAPAKTIDKMFDEVPEFRMSSTAREQADVGLGLWAALSTVPEATGHAIGYADPATYAKMTDIIYDASAGAGDTKPDPTTLQTNAIIGGVKLTAAEWAQVKETFGTYAAIMS